MKSRWPSLAALALAVVAGATWLGLIRWGESLGCALFGQYAFGPMCLAPEALAGVAGVAFLAGLLLWPSSRLEHGHHTAPDEQRAAGDHGNVEGGLEERR